MENRTPVRISVKHAIDDDAMKVQMWVEQRTKAMDEGHGTETGLGTCTRTTLPQALFDGGEEYVQGCVLDGCVVLQVIAQAFGHREHPLAHRQARDDVVGEMGRCLDHAPRGAGGADAATLAGVGDQKIVTAVGAVGAGETEG
jgi:hypothetical protein